MPLTLTIRNADRLENGSPISLVLDRRGATIGRAATNEWCLPDPTLHISSRHCEIRFADDRYELIDNSTNGTFLHGQGARLPGPHAINQGDVFLVGAFEIAASLDEVSASAAAARNAAPTQPEWRGWAAAGGDSPTAPAASQSSWDAAPASSAISGSGPMSQNWAPPKAVPSPGSAASGWAAPPAPLVDQLPVDSAWNTPPPPPSAAASEWSSPSTPPPAPGGDDIWGKFAESNVVDWARGGFGSSPPPPPTPVVAPPPQLPPATGSRAFDSQPQGSNGFGQNETSASAPPLAAAAVPPVAATSGGGLHTLLHAAGIEPDRLKQGEADALATAGGLLRRLVSGMVVMLEARARGKSQMGAQGTNLEFDGNNPLKFARTPEQALAQLLNPPERGFMPSDRAIEDAFKDLQAHQMATLKAMQGALRSTLDRFSPTAIRARAENKGVLAKILPTARDAALWAAYEREFGGVAQGSDEAFMDMFAKEFRRAYEEIASKR